MRSVLHIGAMVVLALGALVLYTLLAGVLASLVIRRTKAGRPAFKPRRPDELDENLARNVAFAHPREAAARQASRRHRPVSRHRPISVPAPRIARGRVPD